MKANAAHLSMKKSTAGNYNNFLLIFGYKTSVTEVLKKPKEELHDSSGFRGLFWFVPHSNHPDSEINTLP